MELQEIFKKLPEIQETLKKGNVFKTELSADQRLQICLFEMFQLKQTGINKEFLKDWHYRKYRMTVNSNNIKNIVDVLWKEEIKEHNRNINSNQKSIF